MILGNHDEKTLLQYENCKIEAVNSLLCADGHVGPRWPVGCVAAYTNKVSWSGVGVDIGCGNNAVLTSLTYDSIKNQMSHIMDDITDKIAFGVGKRNKNRGYMGHPILDDIGRNSGIKSLLQIAETQLGSVGGGNHYVDILKDEQNRIWVANHFGSRKFGHDAAKGYLALSQGLNFRDKVKEGDMMAPPVLFDMNTQLGQDYFDAHDLCCQYALVGRRLVINKVLQILGAHGQDFINNHHNFCQLVRLQDGKEVYVTRKGCTPIYANVKAFIGGSMGDVSAIVEGIEGPELEDHLYTGPHGSGRTMSRTQAGGKKRWPKGHHRKPGEGYRAPVRSGGIVNWDRVKQELGAQGVELRGGDAEEAPECYRPLRGVLEAHRATIRVVHYLQPIGVAMAPRGTESDD